MALVFADGFDYYNTNAYFLTLWTGIQGNRAPNAVGTGRFGVGRSMDMTFTMWKDIPALATYIVAFAFKWGGGSTTLLSFDDTVGNVQHVILKLTAGNFLTVTSGGTTLGTATVALSANIWYHIQIKVKVDPTTGTVEVRVDGNTTPVITVTGANTRQGSNSSTNRIEFLNFGTSSDDFMILDTTGGFNNDFPGDCKITTVVPTGNGATNNFTPSAGANWQNVKENPQDDDTTYNSDSTVGDIDLYAFAAISTTGAIIAVRNNMTYRKDDAGVRQIASICRSGVTNFVGGTKTASSNYKTDTETYETDPNTGVAWTQTNLNNAQFGAKVIT